MLTEQAVHISDTCYDKNAIVYSDSEIKPKACILYFHGGGLLYGTKSDLPDTHKKTLTQAGYCIIAFDYPLAPAVKLDTILEDACASVNSYLERPELYLGHLPDSGGDGSGKGSASKAEAALPYFLWGRSAGAYLSLLTAAKGEFQKAPQGILSYYGYGFLCDGWFLTPSRYYQTLPPVAESALDAIPSEIHAEGDLNTHYSVYVYARQTGTWTDLIYEGRQKFFYLDYTLRLCDKLPCPLFCAHSTGDTDVPYEEFLELCNKFRAQRFVASHTMHDFDRDEENPITGRLLEATIKSLEAKLN